jgi:hypothetical protein
MIDLCTIAGQILTDVLGGMRAGRINGAVFDGHLQNLSPGTGPYDGVGATAIRGPPPHPDLMLTVGHR